MPLATTWVNLEDIMLSKRDSERKILYDIIYMWTPKTKQNKN